MPVTAMSSSNVAVPIDGEWLLSVLVTDLDGRAVDDDALVVTVTLPSGGSATAPALERVAAGVYRGVYLPANTGRHIARIRSMTYGVADFVAWIDGVVDGAGMPGLSDVVTYLGGADQHSWSDDEIRDALEAEAGAQRDCCDVPAAYPKTLRQALLRRTQRNLAMRALPLAALRGDGEGGDTTLLPGRDPEVIRFERPHRKLPTG